MNSFEEGGQRHEIIIVKRNLGDDEEGHHGGVWKIAFADFMTAMMCFFLVMWLINAADEETRTALASYFNPVNLVDRNSSTRGLLEPEGPQPNKATTESEAAPEKGATSEEKQDDASDIAPRSDAAPAEPTDGKLQSDERLFSNPYAVLAEIAAETGAMQNVSSKGDGGAQTSGPATGASGGESYRDPFAPDFWSRQVQGMETAIPVEDAEKADIGTAAAEQPTPERTAAEMSEKDRQPETVANKRTETEAAGADRVPPAETEAAAAPVDQQTIGPAVEEAKAAEVPLKKEPPVSPVRELREPTPKQIETAELIQREVAEAFGDDAKLLDGISVAATDRGIVISITDQLNFGMFEIGSAVPRREMVLAMEKIGKVLSGREGNVVVNGHTDGRPFRSGAYDNWRLSTARAHAAYYMLVRGGLTEERIVEIAGFADRKLKVADNPEADANRRIEVLLEVGG